MKGTLTKLTCGFLTTACLAFALAACSGIPDKVVISTHETRRDGPVITHREGPPPWAPAHGQRAKHRYRYYPSGCVYQDVGTGVYFYRESGYWKVSVSLPAAITVDLGDSVMLEMDTGEPYTYHQDVVRYYPPGKSKGRR